MPYASHVSRRSSAFTLIELLVVVAIIVVLISVLMPGLAGARNRAKAVVCTSNLRQIGAGFLMYTQEYNGTLPKAKNRDVDWSVGWWHYVLRPQMGMFPIPSTDTTTQRLGKMMAGIFHCPAKPNYNAVSAQVVDQISYAMNAFAPNGGDALKNWNKISTRESSELLVSDARIEEPEVRNNQYLYGLVSGKPYITEALDHPGRCDGVLFVDGSTDLLPRNALTWDLKRIRP